MSESELFPSNQLLQRLREPTGFHMGYAEEAAQEIERLTGIVRALTAGARRIDYECPHCHRQVVFGDSVCPVTKEQHRPMQPVVETTPPPPACTCAPPKFEGNERYGTFTSGRIDPSCPLHWRQTLIQNGSPSETTTALTARCDKHVPTHGHGDTRCARELHHTGSHICPVSIASAQCRWAWTELQGLPVEPTGTYTNEAPAHPPIMPKRFNSTSTPENGN